MCDDEFFVKITEAGKQYGLSEKPPYDGAKNYFLVEDTDNADFLTELVSATVAELPEPKPKKPKKPKGE